MSNSDTVILENQMHHDRKHFITYPIRNTSYYCKKNKQNKWDKLTYNKKN